LLSSLAVKPKRKGSLARASVFIGDEMNNEPFVRLAVFLGVLLLMFGGELLAPRRKLAAPKGRRWLANLGLVVVDSLVLRLIFPLMAVGLALRAEQSGWGILNNLSLSDGWSLLAGLAALDFVIYLQHMTFHYLPTLWRLHKVHHLDVDIDVSTALRFHPVEIVLSMLVKMGAVLLIGPSAVTVVIFEVVLNATAMFNHANLRLPLGVDRILRLVLVTPDMHRVHHSVIMRETNSNFGFNFPWWDRLLGSYRAQPAEGHLAMTIGLKDYRGRGTHSLGYLLALPFRSTRGAQRKDSNSSR